MEVVAKKLNEIKPYEKNPRRNDDAVETVLLPVTQRIAKAVAKHEEVTPCPAEHTQTASQT